jgi:hypothetical protein
MSTFSKRYSLPGQADQSIYLTWESGYKNVKVYENGRLITTIARPTEFKSGFYYEDKTLGNIKIQFSSNKPIVLTISVEGTSYFPENSKNDREGFAGLVTLFWVIFGIGTVVTIIAYSLIGGMFDSSLFAAAISIDVAILASYVITAIYLSKRKGWAYFLGVTTFIIATLIALYSYINTLGGLTIFPIIILAVRGAFIIYMLTFLKNALVAMRAPSAEMDDELLDN